MKKSAIALIAAGTLFSITSWAEMDTENGQINYKIGSDVGKYLNDSELEFDKDSFLKGLEDGLSGRELRLTNEELNNIRGIIQKKQMEVQKAKRAEMMAQMENRKLKMPKKAVLSWPPKPKKTG